MVMLIHKTIKTKKGKKYMELNQGNVIEPVTISEVLSLTSWDRPRTNEELKDFISQREAAVHVF